MKEAGADLIELDIPFSDPTAEGPVIQEANIRALSGGVTTDIIFDMVAKIRKNTQIPMVFMTYANVVYSYGTERYAQCVSGNTIFSSENSYLCAVTICQLVTEYDGLSSCYFPYKMLS